MTKSSKNIEKRILKKITPTSNERKTLATVINTLIQAVTREIEQRKVPIAVELVGSTAKDTFLRKNLDIDLFLLFPSSVSRDDLEKHGLAIGRSILENTEECYAEHPYVRGYYKKYKTEIIPCYNIESAAQKLSAVDRTPFHTKYVREHLKESQKKEVRLFKQFLKGIGCYGAEAEIEGFSGYLCEILIIYYGTFRKIIDNAQCWQIGEKLYLKKGSYPDFDTPLTCIDPVDTNRNVASALSLEKFQLFIRACQAYAQHPRSTFFFPNKLQSWSLEKISRETEKRGAGFIGIRIERPDIISENLYPQLRKGIRSIKELCERYDFTIIDTTFFINQADIYYILQTTTELLPKTLVHQGPPITMKQNAKDFIKKWKNHPRMIKKPYEKNGRLYVEVEREYRSIKNLLNDQVKTLSLGRHIDEHMKKRGYTIVEIYELLIHDLRVFWTTYLDKRMPWER